MLYQTPTRETAGIPTLYNHSLTSFFNAGDSPSPLYKTEHTGITNLYIVIEF